MARGWRTEERSEELRVKEEELADWHVPAHILMDRHDLVKSAVTFLSDPSVGS